MLIKGHNYRPIAFADGRIVVAGRKGRRRPGKRAHYILRYRPDCPST
jgi:type I restriction enzyme R subunit